MAYQYKSKAMQEWSGQTTPSSEYEYKSKAMRDYMANASRYEKPQETAEDEIDEKAANYNRMQELVAKSEPTSPSPVVDRYAEQLADINRQIGAISGYGAGADRSNLNKLFEKQYELEQKTKTGRFDENLNFAERLQLTAQGIGESYNAMPSVLTDTAVQAVKDTARNVQNKDYRQDRKQQIIADGEVARLERMADRGMLDQTGLAHLKNLQAQKEQMRQSIADKYSTPMNMETDGVKAMQRAMQAQRQATYGMGKTGAFLLNTGASIAENASLMPLVALPGGQSIPLAMMGARQAAQKAVEVGESGRSAGEALLRGLSSGAVEAATEKLPLDRLTDMIKGKAGKEFLLNMAKQAGLEGTEEGIAYLGNLVLDQAAKDPNAEFSLAELGASVLGGALSGGVMGAGGSLVGNRANKNDIIAQPNEAESANNEAENTDTLDNNASRASSEGVKAKVAENAALSAENGTKNSNLDSYNAENTQLSEKTFALPQSKQVMRDTTAEDINALNKQPEIAPETNLLNKTANLSNEAETQQNGQNLPSINRYGEVGRREFAKVQNDAVKAAEFDEIYRAGQAGQQMPAKENGVLTKAEKGSAFMAGVADGKTNRESYANKDVVINKNAGLDMGTANHIALKNRQTLDRLGKALGVRISFADNVNGNGMYKINSGEIIINRNVGDAYKVVTSHEVIHRLRQTAPDEFYKLATAVMEYNAVGNETIAEYDSLYGLNEGDIDYYDMLEEIVADFVSNRADAQTLADMLAKEPTVFEKFVAAVKEILEKLNLVKDADVQKVKDEWENILDLLGNTVKAGQKYTEQATNAEGDVLTIKDNKTGETRYNLWSYRNGGRKVLTDTLEKQKFPAVDVKRAADLMDEMAVMMENFARDYATVLDWNNTEVLYDQHGKTYYSAMVKNGDYKINIDLSTICKKRIALQNVLNRLVKQNLINDVSLSPENIATINRILKENGYETQCPACFVESKRYNIEKWANDFADKWNGVLAEAGFTPNGSFDFSHGKNSDHMDAAAMLADDLSKADAMLANIGTPKRDENGNILYKKNGRPQMYQANSKQRIVKLLRDNPQLRKTFTAQDLIGTEGIRNIKTQYPEIYSLILTNWGVATPKIVQTTVPYNNEVAVYKNIAKKSKYIGGVRMFSFSDFTIDQVFDYVQVVADLYAQKAMMHTYTKEIAFAKLFGTTGIKINLSYIPAIDKSVGKENAGLNAKGELIYSEWGVQPDEAEALMKDRRYSPNITPIMIGVSDNHIRKLLDTDSIRFIIPYHKSSLNPVVAKMTDIENYKDYSDEQTTRHKDGTSLSKAENNKFDFYKTLEKTKDARKAADAYLEWCDENGYLPKFEQFREHENYYKLLVDFNLYDAVTGEFVPQKPVTMTFPEEFSRIVGEELAKQKGLSDKLGIKDDQVFKQIVGAIKKDKSGDVRYSLNPNFKKEYDLWSKKYPNTDRAFTVGTTSEALKLIGVKDGTIKWDTKKIRKIKNDHPEITDGVIKQVPELLENPIIVMESKTADSRIIMFGEVYGTNGLPVMAVLELEPTNIKGEYLLDTLKVVNSYTKDNNVSATQNLINKSRLLYIEPNKNKTNTWLKANRLQLPSAAKYGPINKVTYSADYVKVEREADSTRDSKKQPTIPDGYKERGYNESARTKTDLPEDVKQEFIDNPEIYKQLANKVTSTKAAQILARGAEYAEAEFTRLLDKMDATAIPLGYNLAKQYIDEGNRERAVGILREMSRQLTKAGQFSQAAAITLMRGDPMTALRYVEREIDKLNADGHKQFGKKWKDFELTPEEQAMFRDIKQGDEEGIKAAYEKINKRIAKEYPSTIWQKFVEASRISMLLNPRTNVKNVVSNFFLRPVTRVSGKMSAALQKAYTHIDKNYTPTQAVLVKKETKALAEEVWNNVKDTFDNANKYNEGIKANKRDIVVFKEGIGTRVMENIAPGTLHKLNSIMGKEDAGLMETLRHATYYFLELGDNRYVHKNFVDRLGSYLQAQDITSLDNVDQDVIDAGVQVAYKEALRATFKDDTALSNWLASIKHTDSPYLNILMEMIIPFTKTPANIAMRGIDYSPVGVLNTISKMKKGADASEVIDELSKNLVGSALIAFGMWLFSRGFVTGGEPADKDKAEFMKQQGWQPYAVKAGNKYVTYDWMQPAAIPVIMGVTVMESLEEGRLGVVDAVKNAGVASFNQWIELSPLQSLQEVMGGYGTVGENLLNTAIEMPQRLIPSASGATARTVDTTQRVTYSKGNVAQTQKDLAKSKVPGLSQTLPAAYDTWGREKKRDSSTGMAVINQYLNPSSTKSIKTSEMDTEIERLFDETGDSGVFPRKASYSFTKGNETYTLSNKEYSEYQRIMGELSYDSVKALMAKPAYSSLTDLEKAEIIKDIYDNAFEKAKFTIMEGQGYEKTSEDIRTAKETKIKQVYMEATPENTAEYYIAYYILNNAESDKASNGKTIAGSKKKNGINRLVEIGFTRSRAEKLYEAMH